MVLSIGVNVAYMMMRDSLKSRNNTNKLSDGGSSRPNTPVFCHQTPFCQVMALVRALQQCPFHAGKGCLKAS